MERRFHKFLISDDILRKYRLLCVEMGLSMTKQTEALIIQFIQVQKDNAKIQRELRKICKLPNK